MKKGGKKYMTMMDALSDNMVEAMETDNDAYIEEYLDVCEDLAGISDNVDELMQGLVVKGD